MYILLFCAQQAYTSDNPSVITLYAQGYVPSAELVSKLAAIGLNNIKTHVDSQYVSAVNTVNNYISDDAGLLKVGYPPTTEQACKELSKWQEISHRYLKAITAYQKYPGFENDKAFVGRRESFIKRAIALVPNRTDGVDIAHWCLKHFQLVMNQFDQAILATFIKAQTERSQQRTLALQNQLKDILGVVDNSVLEGWTVIESDQTSSSEKREDTADEIAEKK